MVKDHRTVVGASVPGWNDPKTGDYVWGYSQGGGFHSENHILDQLAARNFKPTQITALYSERQPCPACGPLLENVLKPGTPISWSVPWGSDALMNSVADDMLKRAIKAAGGHRALGARPQDVAGVSRSAHRARGTDHLTTGE
ncbi:nucleic acid/nucleotide deaminase domain-containing protein [Streptomyces sp. AS02]|uniref:nucleic acid/nucleotide deaminase domain-containing protein n=1 Tax=Streptomyces sp. AS02 TaxID=2938946 RepID=UPI00202071BB|nr:nucleic acid/nucleotide deaminase domain-containing protein [Streptomyces sp. AS02]MCL8014551.1 hypothetical protein [Streptomyces sp. AS02]